MHEARRRRLVEELAEGGRRAAKPLDCERCGAPVLRGDDHDECALVVTVDLDPVDPVGEMVAILDGRPTFDLLKQAAQRGRKTGHALYYREPWHVHSDRPHKGTVHRAHRCRPEDMNRKDTLF